MAGFYRRHIEGYSKIARPLSELTKKEKPYMWTDACEKAFIELKNRLKTHPVLKVVEWDKQFTFTTDASKFAIGAVLEQELDGKRHPVGMQVEN